MGRGILALAGCLVATVALTGCDLGGENTGPDPTYHGPRADEALQWTCDDFQSAQDSERLAAIERLAQEVSKRTGKPVGKGEKVDAAVESFCKDASDDAVVGSVAVDAVVAGGEDPAAGTPTETTTPAQTTTPAVTTTSTTTTTDASGTGSGSENTYCYEADLPNRSEPGCQGYYGPPPSGAG
jgi:hypothetical protein